MPLKWRIYGMVRPIVRPVARRLRMFFVGRLHDELAELRAEIGALHAAIERQQTLTTAGVDQRVSEVIAQALATLALDGAALDEPAPDQALDQTPVGLPFST